MKRLLVIAAAAALGLVLTGCGGADDSTLFDEGQAQDSASGPEAYETGDSSSGLDAGPEPAEKPVSDPRLGQTQAPGPSDDSGPAEAPDGGISVPDEPDPDPAPVPTGTSEPEPEPPPPEPELDYDCETWDPNAGDFLPVEGLCLTEVEFDDVATSGYPYVSWDQANCHEPERCIPCWIRGNWTGVCELLPPRPDDCRVDFCPVIACLDGAPVNSCGTHICSYDDSNSCDGYRCNVGYRKPLDISGFVCEPIP